MDFDADPVWSALVKSSVFSLSREVQGYLRFFLRGVISPVPSQVVHFWPWTFPVPRHTGHNFAEDLAEDDIKGSSPTLYSECLLCQ